MKSFTEICEAIRKSMQEMNSPAAIRAQGEAFVKNLQTLEEKFNAACQEAKQKNKKEAFPDNPIWTKLLDLAGDIRVFLESLDHKTTASLESLSFLQIHLGTIDAVLMSLSKSKIYAGRGGIRNSWTTIMTAVNALKMALSLGSFKDRMAKLSKAQDLPVSASPAAAPKDAALVTALSHQSAAGLGIQANAAPVADLMKRFHQIFVTLDSSSDLDAVRNALSVLEEILALKVIDTKEADELRAMVFNDSLGGQLENMAMSLHLIITNLRAEKPENCRESQNCFNRLAAILANAVLAKYNSASLEDVYEYLRGTADYIKTSVTFAAVLRTIDLASSGNPAHGSVAARAAPQEKAEKDPTQESKKVGEQARAAAVLRSTLSDRKESDEIEQVRSKCRSVAEVFAYVNLQKKEKAHTFAKAVLLHMIEVISQAQDAHRLTYDRECIMSHAAKELARRPWEQVLTDMGNEKTHLHSIVRHLVQEITARFEEFNFEEVSRLCHHLANCDLLYTAFYERLERDLMGPLFNFTTEKLEKDCEIACRNVRFGVQGPKGYPSIHEMTNIAHYLQHMGCENPDVIQRIVLLAATAVANVDRTKIRLQEAAIIGNLSHSIGIMSHYLESFGQVKMIKLIRTFHEPVLIFGAQLANQGLKDEASRKLFKCYKRGVGSMADNTRAYADKTLWDVYDGLLRVCLEELRTEKPSIEQTRFSADVERALTKSFHLFTTEGDGISSNGKRGKNRILLRAEHLIPPFQYDYLLSKGKYFFTLEANGKAYHYLNTLFSDEQCPPRFDVLNGKSRLKRNLVHGKCLQLLKGQAAKKVLAIDIHQTEFDKRKNSRTSYEYIQELIDAAVAADQAEIKAEAEAKARKEAETAAAAAAQAKAEAQAQNLRAEEARAAIEQKARAEAEAKAKALEAEARTRAIAEAKAKEEIAKLAEISLREQILAAEEVRLKEEELRRKGLNTKAPAFCPTEVHEQAEFSADHASMSPMPAHYHYMEGHSHSHMHHQVPCFTSAASRSQQHSCAAPTYQTTGPGLPMMFHSAAQQNIYENKESDEQRRLKFLAQAELHWLQMQEDAKQELEIVERSLFDSCKDHKWIPHLLSQTKAFGNLQFAIRNLQQISREQYMIFQKFHYQAMVAQDAMSAHYAMPSHSVHHAASGRDTPVLVTPAMHQRTHSGGGSFPGTHVSRLSDSGLSHSAMVDGHHVSPVSPQIPPKRVASAPHTPVASVSEDGPSLPPPLVPQRASSGTINIIQINNNQFSPQFNVLSLHAAGQTVGSQHQHAAAAPPEPVSVEPLFFTQQAQSLAPAKKAVAHVAHAVAEDSQVTLEGPPSKDEATRTLQALATMAMDKFKQ